MDLPAVCGIPGLTFIDSGCKFQDVFVAEGEYISIDGSLGEVYLGAVPRIPPPKDQRVDRLLSVCDSLRRIPVFVEEAPAPPWSDGVRDSSEVTIVRNVSEFMIADGSSAPLVIDIGQSEDPQSLLEALASRDVSGDSYLRVDAKWPASIRQLPAVPWTGLVTDEAGAGAARLLAATAAGGGH